MNTRAPALVISGTKIQRRKYRYEVSDLEVPYPVVTRKVLDGKGKVGIFIIGPLLFFVELYQAQRQRNLLMYKGRDDTW